MPARSAAAARLHRPLPTMCVVEATALLVEAEGGSSEGRRRMIGWVSCGPKASVSSVPRLRLRRHWALACPGIFAFWGTQSKAGDAGLGQRRPLPSLPKPRHAPRRKATRGPLRRRPPNTTHAHQHSPHTPQFSWPPTPPPYTHTALRTYTHAYTLPLHHATHSVQLSPGPTYRQGCTVGSTAVPALSGERPAQQAQATAKPLGFPA